MSATPFTKLLVANRGEVAVRVMRTARAMGYRTVAIFSDADAGAVHVAVADEAIGIGGTLPAQSYLDIAKVIAAARRCGADAVHPGYGFLAENAFFAQACREAGLTFVGPSPEAIVSMGDKAEAKRLMQAAGVPCIPGYQGSDQSEDRLFAEGQAIGWPVMIKAVAGGGGRGMRLVGSADEFAPALASARSEAVSAFGNGDMLLEQAIIDPRHVEIQVFADRYGNAIHLGERDCSVQRRHQKVIEEAPSPAVDADLRERMGSTAITAVLSIGYEGAGTFEFLLDRDRNFYFMEMNTRLQVEHPVTEAITGLDLVELQLRVAAGEPLPLAQEDVTFAGHAIEVRLCAEDPDAGFIPQSGRMSRWAVPAGLRTDHALASGSEISPFYDSMIAKLISHGATREEARRKLVTGLNETVALGVATNRAFAARCLMHPTFVAGQATTGFIAAAAEELRASDTAAKTAALVGAAVLSCVNQPTFLGAPSLAYRGLVAMRLGINAAVHEINVTRLGDAEFEVGSGGKFRRIALTRTGDEVAAINLDGVNSAVNWLIEEGRLLIQFAGEAYEIHDLSFAAVISGEDDASDGRILASMTGRVVAVHASVGDQIEAGQSIATLEAMKMEQAHFAPISGQLQALHVAVGDQVASGRVIAEIVAEIVAEKGAKS